MAELEWEIVLDSESVLEVGCIIACHVKNVTG